MGNWGMGMMREIKFRAWDKSKRKMMITRYFDMWYYTIAEQDETGRSRATECKDKQDYCRNNLEIMQYIGLKDRKGKEIYEGDVVKIPDWNEDFTDTIEVVEDMSEWLQEYGFRVEETTLEMNKIEILGNIYENPELLEDR